MNTPQPQSRPARSVCSACGTPSVRKFCSNRCKWAGARRAPCATCGSPTGYRASDPNAGVARCTQCHQTSKPEPKCKHGRGNAVTQWTCQRCGVECSRPPTRGQEPRFCGTQCEQAAAAERRRARLIDAFIEDVPRHKVFEADGYRCHICRRLTDRTKKVPHPLAPTVDHLLPLAKGGKHERSNCRTACFRCNCTKQDRGGGEQYALTMECTA